MVALKTNGGRRTRHLRAGTRIIAGSGLRSIERGAFTTATGYPAGTRIDGIELRDRVWLDVPPDAGTRADV
jgi:hypothetical protein